MFIPNRGVEYCINKKIFLYDNLSADILQVWIYTTKERKFSYVDISLSDPLSTLAYLKAFYPHREVWWKVNGCRVSEQEFLSALNDT